MAKVKEFVCEHHPEIAMSRDQSIQAKKGAQLLEGRGFRSFGCFGDLWFIFYLLYVVCSHLCWACVWQLNENRPSYNHSLGNGGARHLRILWDCSNRHDDGCNLFCLSD